MSVEVLKLKSWVTDMDDVGWERVGERVRNVRNSVERCIVWILWYESD